MSEPDRGRRRWARKEEACRGGRGARKCPVNSDRDGIKEKLSAVEAGVEVVGAGR